MWLHGNTWDSHSGGPGLNPIADQSDYGSQSKYRIQSSFQTSLNLVNHEKGWLNKEMIEERYKWPTYEI